MFSHKYLIMLLTSIALLVLSACTPQQNNSDRITGGRDIKGLNEFIAQLRDNGATVVLGEQFSQPFFSTSAQIVHINEKDVQVFEFPDIAARETAQATISSDGTTIGTSMVTWMETPHFWGKGNLIVLYVGSDPATIELLNAMLN